VEIWALKKRLFFSSKKGLPSKKQYKNVPAQKKKKQKEKKNTISCKETILFALFLWTEKTLTLKLFSKPRPFLHQRFRKFVFMFNKATSKRTKSD